MGKQKTAVEFLYEFVLLKLSNEQQMQFEGLFNQAKQMEKEQTISFAEECIHKDDCFFIVLQYYESKYGKDENKAENND